MDKVDEILFFTLDDLLYIIFYKTLSVCRSNDFLRIEESGDSNEANLIMTENGFLRVIFAS